MKAQTLWRSHHTLINRIIILSIASLGILLTAGACSFPGIGTREAVTLGILKKDPEIRDEGFGRINTVQTLDGERVTGGLSTISGLKLLQISDNSLLYLTKQKGLFYTDNGGRIWERKYVFPVGSDAENQNDRQNQINGQIAKNDSFITSDIAFDRNNTNVWYVSGVYENVGKIYKTTNNGDTFEEIYSEVEDEIGVSFVAVDPGNSNIIVAALQEGALIRSEDKGDTWQKIRSFDDVPVQMGFVEEFNNVLFVLFSNEGLAVSSNAGDTFEITPLTKSESRIGERQPEDGINLDFDPVFGSYEKIVPVTAQSTQQWILIADRQMWYTSSLAEPFIKLVLPLQNEQFNLLDVEPDPIEGLNKIYVSVDDKLFHTNNQGQSWSTGDLVQVSTPIGFIGDIVVDNDNPEIMYLMLVEQGARRGSGEFGGFDQ